MSWNDDELAAALERYVAIGRQNGMREKALNSYWAYGRRFIDWRKGDYRPRGMSPSVRPTPIGRATTADLRRDVGAYARVVEEAGRAQDTVDTYHRHAMFFKIGRAHV